MLPLVSRTMPRLTGTRSALKCVTVCELIVFVDEEVLLPETGHESAARVGHRRRDVDQLDAALEPERIATLIGARGGRLLPAQRGDGQKNGGERRTQFLNF